MKAISIRSLAAGLLVAAVAGAGAQAQTQPADKPVTRDELRACMSTEAELADRRKAMEARVPQNKAEADALTAERAEIADEEKALGDSEYRIRRFKLKVTAHNEKLKVATANRAAFNTDLEALNQAVTAYNGKCGGITFSAEDKAAIVKERESAGKK